MKTKITLENIIAYIEGNIRYKLYYSKFKFLIPKHIIQQIRWRIIVMDKECYQNGSCKLCGCKTTALQMANKTCDGKCYPAMMCRDEWVFLLKWVVMNGYDLGPIFKALGKHEYYFSSSNKEMKIIYLTKIVKEIENGKLGKVTNRIGEPFKRK